MTTGKITTSVDPVAIIERYYDSHSRLYAILMAHGRAVADKSLKLAQSLDQALKDNLDMAFLEEAALLHDIGIIRVNAPSLGCNGEPPYVCHGVLGREMLETLGLERHALVCERHVGVGITVDEIRKQNLPLPLRDMRPVTLEEKIISYADKFFSKDGRQALGHERSVAEVADKLKKYGHRQVATFLEWAAFFGETVG